MPRENQENTRSSINRSSMDDSVTKQDGGTTDIWRAAEMGSIEVVKSLLSKGAKANALSVRKKTPLHYAVVGGSLECVEYLLKNGADKALQDDKDKTALDYCKMFSDESKYGKFLFFSFFLFFFLIFERINFQLGRRNLCRVDSTSLQSLLQLQLMSLLFFCFFFSSYYFLASSYDLCFFFFFPLVSLCRRRRVVSDGD
jgi:hypothetical protein